MTDYINPSMVAMNIIRYIGDEIHSTGEPVGQISSLSNIAGCQNEQIAIDIFLELYESGIIRQSNPDPKLFDGYIFSDVSLSLEGWDQYEAEKQGKLDGNYGFLAMAFNEPELDAFVKDVLKPAVRGAGYDLHHLEDKSRAGVIDNIMRVAIRDARFVLVDLTHDNNGAYWEGGYAEGLGKPVIYLCEKEKFQRSKEEGGGTHFDANHCTTILWSKVDPEEFSKDLIATLRRSLEI